MTHPTEHVLSVSLGSPTRDYHFEWQQDGRTFLVERRGVVGGVMAAVKTIREMRDTVACFGVGGTDIYLGPIEANLITKEGKLMVPAAGSTRMVDGGAIKHSQEERLIEWLIANRPDIPIAGQPTLMPCGMDRFGMARALEAAGNSMVYGDLVFMTAQTPRVFTRLADLLETAKTIWDLFAKLGTSLSYPIGEKQNQPPEEKYPEYYHDAKVIAGDLLIIRRNMPKDLRGKVIITNTVTVENRQEFRDRGVRWLITSTPSFEGRSIATNMLEALLVTLLNKHPRDIEPAEYLAMIDRCQLGPHIERLN